MKLSDLGPVVLLGAGKMGTALARGWLTAGLPPAKLTFVDPQPSDTIKVYAAAKGVTLAGSVPDDPARVLILAVKPQVMGDVLPAIKTSVGPETLVISIAAGINSAAISGWLGTDRIVRTMPNTPAQVGKGITGAVAATGVTAEDREIADALLSAAGLVTWFDDEEMLHAVTAVSGSGPAYIFYFVEALAKAGEAFGLDTEQSMLLARQMVIGAAALMDADPTDAATLRKNVTSPGGTTAEALRVLMAKDGLEPLLYEAMKACQKRSIELGQ